jgi:hypothetical protein
MNRKDYPLFSGVLKYFPDAILEVALCSKVGNDQHNPGEPLHWAREKSTDDADALARHLLGAGNFDDDGVRHSAKVAWRALAVLQKELEAERVTQIKVATARINVERLRRPLRAVIARASCDEYSHWFPRMEVRCFCGQVTRPSPAQIGIDAVSPSWERIPVPPPAQDAYIDEEGDVTR